MSGTDDTPRFGAGLHTGSDTVSESAVFARALDTLRESGMLTHDETPLPGPVSYRDDMPDGWADPPRRVIERTDALDFSDVHWDEGAVIARVREIAALAKIPCADVRVVPSPAAMGELADAPGYLHASAGPDLALSPWNPHFGRLTRVLNVDRWADAFERATPVGVRESPRQRYGRGLLVRADADTFLGVAAEGREASRFSVCTLVIGYVGMMFEFGAPISSADWSPHRETGEEFGVELRLGEALTDAFCAGLGYLAPAGEDILVCRRPAVRFLDQPDEFGATTLFHHESGPAIEFTDGTGLHFLGGGELAEWFFSAVVEGALTMRYVRQIRQPDLRLAAYSAMPPAARLDGLRTDLVDVGTKGTRLHLIHDHPDLDGPTWFMVMTDPSTGREYGEFVPPEIGELRSADAAQAAAWGISESDYRRMSLEG